MAETRHTTTVDIKVDDREVVRLADELNRTFSTNALDTFTKMMERQSGVLATLIKQQEALRSAMEKTAKTRQQGGGGGAGGGIGGEQPSWTNRMSAHAVGHYVGEKAVELGHHVGALPTAAASGSIARAGAAAIPLVGEQVAGTMEAAQKYHEMAMANLNARMGAFGAAGISTDAFKGMQSIGAGMGIDPDAVPGMLESAARQSGLTGGKLVGAAPDMMRAQRFLGVGNAGVVTGAAGAAGGDVSAQRSNALLAQTIGTAVANGVQESKLDEYFSGVAGFVEQMRNRGMPIEPESLNALVAGIGQSHAKSLAGMAGLNAAKSMASGMTPAMGSTGLMSAIMMQITGVTEGKNIFQARREVEAKPMKYAADALKYVKGMLINETNLENRGGMLKQIFDSANIQVSANQAYDLANDRTTVEDEFGPDAVADKQRKGREKLGQRQGLAGGMTHDLRIEAGIKTEAIALGESEHVKHLVHHMAALDQEVAGKVLPAMTHFTDAILTAVEALVRKAPAVLPKAVTALDKAIKPFEDVVDDFAETDLGKFLGVPKIGATDSGEDETYNQYMQRNFPEAGMGKDPTVLPELAITGDTKSKAKPSGGGGHVSKAKLRRVAEAATTFAAHLSDAADQGVVEIDPFAVNEGGGRGGH